jgi:hypothetical protein
LVSEPPSLTTTVQADLISLPNLPTKLWYLWLIAFPQRTYMAQRYGADRAWQLPFWYVYRLGSGGIKFIRSTVRSPRGS